MKLIITALIVDFILLLYNIIIIVHQGFFRDVYPNIEISDDVTYSFWILLFCTIVFFFLLIFLCVKSIKTKYSGKGIFIVLFLILLLVIDIIYGVKYYNITRNHSISYEEDYISEEYYRGISLEELYLNIQSEEKIMIYIGREDCNECEKFEKEFESILEKYHVELPAYYTSQDRNGNKREKMYELLDKYHIDSVPILIVTEKSQLVKIWVEPINHLAEIEMYLKDLF